MARWVLFALAGSGLRCTLPYLVIAASRMSSSQWRLNQATPKPLLTAGQENRKRETRQLAAQVVRREEEMTENHLGDNESEGDAPDDDDDLDEV